MTFTTIDGVSRIFRVLNGVSSTHPRGRNKKRLNAEHPENIVRYFSSSCLALNRSAFFRWVCPKDFLFSCRHNQVEITTSSVSPEIKRLLGHGDVLVLRSSAIYMCACLHACVGDVETVTGGAMRRKSLARVQSGFYVRPFSLPKMITRTKGEISATMRRSLHLSSFLIIVDSKISDISVNQILINSLRLIARKQRGENAFNLIDNILWMLQI